jgi:octaheme c-type cytochrome (tetrathionate reductase family)
MPTQPRPFRAWRLLFAGLIVAVTATPALAASNPPPRVDHSKFTALKGPFATGPDVTKACLSCHTQAAKQVHKSIHWTWSYTNPKTGQKLGKRNVINNFCVSLKSNEARCTSCHVGYGWKDASFDFTSEVNVDCLVCHDQTGTYKKFPTDAGHPNYVKKEFPKGKVWPVPDLAKIAQSVALPGRRNCGACHFFGGGGDAVKHGDIDSSLISPPRAIDVHMSPQGLNFSCATCHVTKSHITAGSRFAPHATYSAGVEAPASCENCHSETPHKTSAQAATLNKHIAKIACATCHVPEFARAKPTKMVWDWSTAGQRRNGKPFVVKNDKGEVDYDTMKGSFKWQANVVPTYRWFNGEITYTLPDMKIDDSKVVPINVVGGSPTDGKSRIWPFKAMRGKQPYDTVNKTLILPHLFGKDNAAFWGHFDWGKAVAAGMKAAGKPYSGKFGFVETVYYWPITHMVAPKEKALTCVQCHSENGRLKDVPGLHIPLF